MNDGCASELQCLGQKEGNFGEGHQQREHRDQGEHKRQNAFENGHGAQLRQHVAHHKHVHAHRRADQPNHHHQNDDDAKPHRVKAQAHYQREEHGQSQQHNGKLFHGRTQNDVSGADEDHHRQGADVVTADQVLQIIGHGGEVHEVGEHQSAHQNHEQHARGAGAVGQDLQSDLEVQRAAQQGNQKSAERADASTFGGGEDAAVNATHDHHKQHRHGPDIFESAQALNPARTLSGRAQFGIAPGQKGYGQTHHQDGQNAGNEARSKQFADVGFGHQPVNDQDGGGWNQNPQSATSGYRASRQLA